jgi:hypothetical protein
MELEVIPVDLKKISGNPAIFIDENSWAPCRAQGSNPVPRV